jgi:hypothetical protein
MRCWYLIYPKIGPKVGVVSGILSRRFRAYGKVKWRKDFVSMITADIVSGHDSIPLLNCPGGDE